MVPARVVIATVLVVALLATDAFASSLQAELHASSVFTPLDDFETATAALSISSNTTAFNTTCGANILGGCQTLILTGDGTGCGPSASIGAGLMTCGTTAACSAVCILQLDGALDNNTDDSRALAVNANLLELGDLVHLVASSDNPTNFTVTVYDQDFGVSVASGTLIGSMITQEFDFNFLSDFVGDADFELVGTIELAFELSAAVDVLVEEFDVVDEQRPGIEGHVFVDCDCNDAIDSGESGISGVAVELDGCGGKVITSTSATGFYRFADLEPCTYTVSVEPTAFGGLCESSDEAVEVVFSSSEVVINFSSSSLAGCSPPPSAVTGFAFGDEYCDGLENGRFNFGRAGVEVTLTGDAVCAVDTLTNTTDASGFYAFVDLPACNYTVSVEDQVCPLAESSVDIIVIPGAEVSVDFALRTPIPISLDNFLNALPLNGSALSVTSFLDSPKSASECGLDDVFGRCHELTVGGLPLGSCNPSAQIIDGSLLAFSGALCDGEATLRLGGEGFVGSSVLSEDLDADATAFHLVVYANEVTPMEVVVTNGGEEFSIQFNVTCSEPCEIDLPFDDFSPVSVNSTSSPTFDNVTQVELHIYSKLDLWAQVDFFGLISTRGNIVGSVFSDCECNGVRDETDNTLSNVTVSLSGCVERETVTNEQGVYAFLNLPPCSSYEVQVEPAVLEPRCDLSDFVHFVAVTDNSVDVDFRAGPNALDTVCPVLPGSVQGRVLFEEGCIGEVLRGAGDVQVQIVGEGSCAYEASTFSNSAGQYVFHSVPGECNYTVSVVGVDEMVCPNRGIDAAVTVAQAQVVTDVDFGLREPLLVATLVDDFEASLTVVHNKFVEGTTFDTSCDALSGGMEGAIIGGCHTGVMTGIAFQACLPTLHVADGVFSCSSGAVCDADCILSLDGNTNSPFADLGLGSFNLSAGGTGFRVAVRSDAAASFQYRLHDDGAVISQGSQQVPNTNGEWYTYDLFFKDFTGLADASRVATIDLRVPPQRSLDIAFRDWELIVPAADIIGTVFGDCNCDLQLDDKESPLEGVALSLSGCGVERTTVTDENGRYFFVNLLPCTYEVEVLSVESVVGFCADLSQRVRVFGETRDVDFGITCFGTVTGFTYADPDCRGVREAGSGLSGVEITVTGIEPHCEGSRTVTSTASGSYQVSSLVPCTYEVSVPAAATSLCPDQPTTQLVIVESGVVEDEVDFRFSALSNIIGTITSSPSCDDEDSVPLPNVVVNLKGVSRCPIDVDVNTNAQGAYAFGRLAPCTYTVTVSPEGGVQCPLQPLSTQVVLLPGVTIRNFDFKFLSHENSFGSISGFVLKDNACDGVFDTPLDGAFGGVTVSLFGEDNCPTQLEATVTLSDGSYSFSGIPPCTYTITLPSNVGQLCPGQALNRRVILPSSASVVDANFLFSGEPARVTTGTISGRVLGDIGCDGLTGGGDRGLDGVSVRIISDIDCIETFSDETTTDINGNYQFNDVEACTHIVSVDENETGSLCPNSDTLITVKVTPGQFVLNADFNVALFRAACDQIDCNDGDECTIDTCSLGICDHEEIPECRRPELCTVDCVDGDSCTSDRCTASTGYCEHAFENTCASRSDVILDDIVVACAAEEITYQYRTKVFNGQHPKFFEMCIPPRTFISASDMVDATTGEVVCTAGDRVLTSRSSGIRGLKWEDCVDSVVGRTLLFEVTIGGLFDIDEENQQTVFVVEESGNYEYLLTAGPYDCDCAGDASADLAGTNGRCSDFSNEFKCIDSTLVEISIVPDKKKRATINERELEDLIATILRVPRIDVQIEAVYFRVGEQVILVRLFNSATGGVSSQQMASELLIAVGSNDPKFIGTPIVDATANIVDLPDVVEGEFTVSAASSFAPLPFLMMFLFSVILAFTTL